MNKTGEKKGVRARQKNKGGGAAGVLLAGRVHLGDGVSAVGVCTKSGRGHGRDIGGPVAFFCPALAFFQLSVSSMKNPQVDSDVRREKN